MARETPGIGLWQAVAAVVAAVGPALVYLLAAGVGEGAAPQAEVARNTLILACVGLVIAVLILILAVAQLPPLLILGPAVVYLFATSDSVVSNTLFTI